MHYSTDNNVPQESELPKWSSRACENVEIKESEEHCMSKEGYCYLKRKFISDFTEKDYGFCMNESVELCEGCEFFGYKEKHEDL